MATFPAAGYLSDAARTQAEIKAALEVFLAATVQLPGGSGVPSTLTIASGSVTPTADAHTIDTEAAAAIDDLANIAQTNIPDGRLLMLRAASATRIVVVKHGAGGAGQIAIADAADFPLLDPTMWLVLRREGALWIEVFRSYGSQVSALRTRYDLATLQAAPNTFTKTQQWAQGANIASAATLVLGTDGNRFVVTGVLGITAISAKPVGTRILLEFSGTSQVTHHAANLKLQNGQNFLATPGDEVELVSIGSGQWKEINRHLVVATLGFQSDPETQAYTFWDDFYGTSDGVAFTPGVGTGGGAWATNLSSGLNVVAGNYRGIIRAVGDGTGAPSVTGGFGTYMAAESPELYVRWAQTGAAATRRIGLSDNVMTGDPVNGIYFRHTAAGNIIAVCRATTESILDTGVASADGVFHTGRLIITPTLVSVYIDGTLKGTIAATIPTAALVLAFGSNSNSSAVGLDVDYIVVKRRR